MLFAESDESLRSKMNEVLNWIKPKFMRTRAVKISSHSSGSHLAISCTCPFHARFGLCCRHIHSVIERNPVLTDAKVRWWRCYREDHVLADSQSTPASERILRLESKLTEGIPMLGDELDMIRGSHVPGTCSDSSANKQLLWFEECLNKIVLHPKSYWKNSALAHRVVNQANNPTGMLSRGIPFGTIEEVARATIHAPARVTNALITPAPKAWNREEARKQWECLSNQVFDKVRNREEFEVVCSILHRADGAMISSAASSRNSGQIHNGETKGHVVSHPDRNFASFYKRKKRHCERVSGNKKNRGKKKKTIDQQLDALVSRRPNSPAARRPNSPAAVMDHVETAEV